MEISLRISACFVRRKTVEKFLLILIAFLDRNINYIIRTQHELCYDQIHIGQENCSICFLTLVFPYFNVWLCGLKEIKLHDCRYALRKLGATRSVGKKWPIQAQLHVRRRNYGGVTR